MKNYTVSPIRRSLYLLSLCGNKKEKSTLRIVFLVSMFLIRVLTVTTSYYGLASPFRCHTIPHGTALHVRIRVSCRKLSSFILLSIGVGFASRRRRRSSLFFHRLLRSKKKRLFLARRTSARIVNWQYAGTSRIPRRLRRPSQAATSANWRLLADYVQ